MRYKIRQKVFSIGDKFTIKNQYEDDVYSVQGKVFSFGDKLRICDMAGNELIYIEQKVFKFLPEYHIYMNNSHVAMVKKEFTFFKPRLYIESSQGRFEVDGGFLAHNFTVAKNGHIVASVDKRILSWSDTYDVDISDSENQALMLALVIVIDQIFHDNNKNNN